MEMRGLKMGRRMNRCYPESLTGFATSVNVR
jgi:hypothetical protein